MATNAKMQAMHAQQQAQAQQQAMAEARSLEVRLRIAEWAARMLGCDTDCSEARIKDAVKQSIAVLDSVDAEFARRELASLKPADLRSQMTRLQDAMTKIEAEVSRRAPPTPVVDPQNDPVEPPLDPPLDREFEALAQKGQG